MDDLRYPIGQFSWKPSSDPGRRLLLLPQLAEMPGHLRTAVANLSPDQLDTAYRPGGWTVRQVVHHLADAQMNWYIRIKLAVTEDSPVVKPYDEARWAELHDARTASPDPSLMLLDGLYRRWVELFQTLSEEQWKRRIVHPERGIMLMDTMLALCVWHGRHHTAHITELRKREGWI
jgi:uncharacterized damage-inducible protein DinB